MGTTGVGAVEREGRRPGWEGRGVRPTASAHSENDLRVNAIAGERGFWRRLGQACILPLPLTDGTATYKLFNRLRPQFSHL